MSYSPLTGLVYFPVARRASVYEIEPNYKAEKWKMSWGTAAPPSEKNAALRAKLREDGARRLAHGVGSGEAERSLARPLRQDQQRRRALDRGQSRRARHEQADVRGVSRDGRQEALGNAGADRCRWPRPITYTVDGEQYIAVNAGGAATLPAVRNVPTGRAAARVLAFKLGGTAVLPPIPPPPAITAPPPSRCQPG